MADSDDSRERKRAYMRVYMPKWLRRNAITQPWRKAYREQKGAATTRRIPFLLTFEEWCAIWEASGKWEQRGTRKGQYCMARFKDAGAYVLGNVRICPNAENHADRAKYMSEESRQLMSLANRGRTLSEDHRKKLSEAAKRQWARHRSSLL
jgi:hypothetical protein